MLPALLFAVLSQTPPSDAFDITALKSKLKGLTDGKGHYVVYNGEQPDNDPLLSGDAKELCVNTVVSSTSLTDSWSISAWDPRVERGAPRGFATVERTGDKYHLFCGARTVELTPVGAGALSKLLSTASIHTSRWSRIPDVLLRDDDGNYYFVDRLRTARAADRRDFRVYRGPRGKLKLLPLKNIIDDSKGTIFSTTDGVLRLITSTDGTRTMKWVAGRVETPLTEVPVDDNVPMIYLDLGPYTGQALGTICDPVY